MDSELKRLLKSILGVAIVIAALLGTIVLCEIRKVNAITQKFSDEQIEKLIKDLGECKKTVDTANQQISVMVAAHNKMVEGTQGIMMQQGREMMVVARALSDGYGQSKWVKMVEKARQELEADAKKAVEEASKQEAEKK
jgi:hypothetical protein